MKLNNVKRNGETQGSGANWMSIAQHRGRGQLHFQMLHDQFLIRPPDRNLMTPDFNQVSTIRRYLIQVDDIRLMNTQEPG